MSNPNRAPLVITNDVVRSVVTHGRGAKAISQEACGLIFGMHDVGTRYVPMVNVAERPARNYAMSLREVGQAIQAAREAGEDLVAVVHSHPTSDAIPSDADEATDDHKPAYLIVGLADSMMPELRAWRFDIEFIGSVRRTEVKIETMDPDAVPSLPPPAVPWALTPGNKVRITYFRPSGMKSRTITTVITEAGPDRAEDEQRKRALGRSEIKMNLTLKPTRGTDPRSMLVERIREVSVLYECPDAGRVRQRATIMAAAAAECIEQDRFKEAQACTQYVNAAFPDWLNYGNG